MPRPHDPPERPAAERPSYRAAAGELIAELQRAAGVSFGLDFPLESLLDRLEENADGRR